MYKSLSLGNGALIALMILSNGLMVEILGNTPATVINHILGLTAALIFFIVTGSRWTSLKGIPIFYLLAGVTGLMTLYMSNIAFLALGATITLMLSMFGRLVASSVIDHYGLMGMKKYPFKPLKFVGLGLMTLGVVLIVIG